MKRLAFFLMFAMVLVSTNCKKDDTVTTNTLEQQFPEWKNLTWISTIPAQANGFKMSLKIVGNVIELTKITNGNTIVEKYRDMGFIESTGSPITSGVMLLSWGMDGADRFQLPFDINRTTKTITVDFITYVVNLKIN